MKLQVKDSGAWRNVLSFDGARQAEVEAAGAALLQAVGCTKTALRIVDGVTVIAYCDQMAFTWREV